MIGGQARVCRSTDCARHKTPIEPRYQLPLFSLILLLQPNRPKPPWAFLRRSPFAGRSLPAMQATSLPFATCHPSFIRTIRTTISCIRPVLPFAVPQFHYCTAASIVTFNKNTRLLVTRDLEHNSPRHVPGLQRPIRLYQVLKWPHLDMHPHLAAPHILHSLQRLRQTAYQIPHNL